jgi:energy-coupling factor transporter ATP-binding protein EcfA2
MYTDEQKTSIVAHIKMWEAKLGSASKVAQKCGVSPAAISTIISGKYKAEGDDMWQTIAVALGWRDTKGWTIAATPALNNYLAFLNSIRERSMCIRLIAESGSGKTTLLNAFTDANPNTAFLIVCRDWSKRQFLNNLLASLGIAQPAHAVTDDLIMAVVDFFSRRQDRPILLIDQANSLKPAALSVIIHLFNYCEDRLAIALCGTEALRVDFTRHIRSNKYGADELDSRFGRTYTIMQGHNKKDVRAICAANGIAEIADADAIFSECKPTKKNIDGRSVDYIADGRTLKKAIQRYHLKAEAERAQKEKTNATQTQTEAA